MKTALFPLSLNTLSCNTGSMTLAPDKIYRPCAALSVTAVLLIVGEAPPT